MQRRTQQPAFVQFVAVYLASGLATILVCYIIVLGVAAAVFGASKAAHNHTSGDHVALEQTFYSYGTQAHDRSPATEAKRQKLAQEFLDIDKATPSDRFYFTFTEYRWQAIEQAAKTGDPMVLTTRRWSFKPFWRFLYGIQGYLIQWLIIGSALIITYAIEADGARPRFHLADLPWRRVWPWIFLVLTGPIGWIVFLVSALRLRAHPQPAEAPAEATLTGDEGQPDQACGSLKSYKTSPKAAQAAYVDLRMNAGQRYRESRLAEIDSELKQKREEVKSAVVEVKSGQSSINSLTADRQRLEKAVSANEAVQDQTMVAEEFERIMALPGVIAVQVVNDRIRIVVRAACEYKERLYDLGDWQMDISPGLVRFLEARCLRSGLRRGWPGGYPAYRLSDGSFCFGDRSTLISEHLVKGQYLEAMALAVEGLNSVNPEDAYRIPDALKLLPEGASRCHTALSTQSS